MEKRYQVFVSSTFSDLEEERQEVMQALLELDCLPAGMELFPAANESQWDLIKKVIQESDYYVLILGGRYGSIGPDGLSYTEMEYRYALEIGKPTIAFLHRDPGKIAAGKSEGSEEGREKLKAFRALVEKKLCKHWDTGQELGSVVSRSLVQLMRTTPAIGWVRGNEVPDREAALELLRLRKQVEELENELQRSRTSAPKGTEGLAQGDEKHSLKITFSSRNSWEYLDSAHYNAEVALTWNQLFATMAPLMIHEANDASLKGALNNLITEKALPIFKRQKDLKDLELRKFAIEESEFQTLKVQFRALGLIAKSDKARSVKDTGTYWTLTPYGDEVMTRLRAIRSIKDPLDEMEATVGEATPDQI